MQKMIMYGVIGLVFCLMVLISADVERKQVKNGLITERIGEARILKAEWTVAIAIHAPEVPPMRTWVQDVRKHINNTLRWFSEADLNHTLEGLKRLKADFLSPEVKSLIPSMRKSRKLLGLNVVGDIGHQLFGLATDDEVDALKFEVDQAMKSVKVIHHNEEHLIRILNLTRQYTSENREDIRRLQGHVVQLSERLRAVIGNKDMNRRLFLQIKVTHYFDHWIAALETVAKEYRQECAHFDKVRGALEHEQLTEDILTVNQLQEMLNHLSKHGQVRDISWYYHNTFVDLVIVERRRLIFKVSLWASEPDLYYRWRLSTFPIIKNTYAERLITRVINL